MAFFEDRVMKKNKDWMQEREALRAKAEEAFSSLSLSGFTDKPAETMLHELLVHKFELEMQIEELKRTHAELEEARDRYLDYYDFAPVGYLTVDREGRITESNLMAGSLLGLERAFQAGQRLAGFVSTRDQDHWHRVFMNMIEDPETEQLGLVLEMARADGTTFDAYLDCRRVQPADASPTVRITLVDVGKIRQVEAETKNPSPPPSP